MYANEINALLDEAFRNNNAKLGARIFENLKNKKGKLLLLTNDMPMRQLELYKSEAEKSQIPYIVFGTTDDLKQAIGRSNHKALIITENECAVKLREYFSFLQDKGKILKN